MRRLSFVFLLLLITPSLAWAACSWVGNTGTVASPYAYTDFNACTTDAGGKIGEVIIQIPASVNVTWSTGVMVDIRNATMPNVTKLTVQGMNTSNQGSGSTQTIITSSYSGKLFWLVAAPGKTIIIKDIKLIGGSGSSSELMEIENASATVESTFRVTNILFSEMQGSGIILNGYPMFGVVDNCYFTDSNGDGNINAIQFYGNGLAYPNQGQTWLDAPDWGGHSYSFFENNTINYTYNTHNALSDAHVGARFVMRYNTFINSSIGIHGYDSGVSSAHSYEIYNNSFTYNLGATPWPWMAYPRGGSGVFYNNTAGGTQGYSYGMVLVYYRSDCPNGSTCGTYGTGKCDGTRAEDGNTDATGYPCYEQPGTTSGGTKPGTLSSPIYIWGNSGYISGEYGCDNEYGSVGCTSHMKLGRDYFNSAKPGYSSYTCPHPLAGLTGYCNPAIAGVTGYNIDVKSTSGGKLTGGTLK